MTVEWYLSNQSWLEEVTSGNYTKYYEKMYTTGKSDIKLPLDLLSGCFLKRYLLNDHYLDLGELIPPGDLRKLSVPGQVPLLSPRCNP
jgi:hypothetical protein